MQSFTHITQDDSHSSPPYIRIDKVNKFYQGQAQTIHALKDISLEVPTGKILGIIGKSGAGKSSLLRIINGLESISDGHVYIDDNNVAALSRGSNEPSTAATAATRHWYDFSAFQSAVEQNGTRQRRLAIKSRQGESS